MDLNEFRSHELGNLAGMHTPSLDALATELDAVDGTVSVWCGRPGKRPAYARNEHAAHYAASTMKVAVMAAAHRLADAGRLDLDEPIEVRAEFTSGAPEAGIYKVHEDYDNDEKPWRRLGSTAPLRWLIRRMIVKSSNLATNLVIERVREVDSDAIGAAWADAGATASVTPRGIEDYAARDAGLDNIVTAHDLAALMTAVQTQGIASRDACIEMLAVLLAQESTDDILRGLPPGTRVAHKNGWVDGINHSVAIVLPDDAPEFVLASCISAPVGHEEGRALLARIAAAAWDDRHGLARHAALDADA